MYFTSKIFFQGRKSSTQTDISKSNLNCNHENMASNTSKQLQIISLVK